MTFEYMNGHIRHWVLLMRILKLISVWLCFMSKEMVKKFVEEEPSENSMLYNLKNVKRRHFDS